jgi:hypothetical protein
MYTDPLIIDQQMPQYDKAIAEHRIVDASPSMVFEAARDLDFMTVHTPLLDAAFWVRSRPARLRGRLEPAPPQVRLTGGPEGGMPGWMLLGERSDQELAFGAVGVFWRGVIEWRKVAADEFAGFAEPGFGKIACNFSVRPYGSQRTVLTFDCRVAVTDELSRRAFRRYWTVIRPFVAHIMRAALATIDADVTRRPRTSASA